MMKRRFKENNKGYTLVEMIIVIAIIAVLSGLAMVTLTLMHSAKAKEASISFNSAVSEQISKAKGSYCDVNGDGTVDSSEKGYVYCLKLYKNGNTYYVQRGACLKSNAIANPSASFVALPKVNGTDGKGTSLSSYVDIKYTMFTYNEVTGSYTKTTSTVDSTGVYVVYNKSGKCIHGDGDYEFYKKNGNRIARVVLNKNGSHRSY